MMKLQRYPLLLAVILLINTNAGAQEKGLSFSMGAASFSMDDMQYYQEYILGTYPVQGRIISTFPVYTTGSFNYVHQLYPHIRIGGGYSFSNTGAKSNYTDQSGSINTILTAISNRIGAFISFRIMGNEHLDLFLYGRLDANFTALEINTSVYANWYSANLINNYRSVSPNGTAGLELLYTFGSFGLGIEGGYLLDLPGKLKEVQSGDYLYDPEQNQVILTSDWTGWRSGIKVVVWLQ